MLGSYAQGQTVEAHSLFTRTTLNDEDAAKEDLRYTTSAAEYFQQFSKRGNRVDKTLENQAFKIN